MIRTRIQKAIKRDHKSSLQKKTCSAVVQGLPEFSLPHARRQARMPDRVHDLDLLGGFAELVHRAQVPAEAAWHVRSPLNWAQCKESRRFRSTK